MASVIPESMRCPHRHQPSGLQCEKRKGHPLACTTMDRNQRTQPGALTFASKPEGTNHLGALTNEFGTLLFFHDADKPCGYCRRTSCASLGPCEESREAMRHALEEEIARGR